MKFDIDKNCFEPLRKAGDFITPDKKMDGFYHVENFKESVQFEMDTGKFIG